MAEYNGYTNYATWLVSMHVDNDPFLLEDFENIAARAESIYIAQLLLKEALIDFLEQELGYSPFTNMLATSLIIASLGDVDFIQLAQNWRQTYNENHGVEDESED